MAGNIGVKGLNIRQTRHCVPVCECVSVFNIETFHGWLGGKQVGKCDFNENPVVPWTSTEGFSI